MNIAIIPARGGSKRIPKKGEVITIGHVKSIRPGYGLAPKYYEEVLSKMAKNDITIGTELNWNLIK